MAGRDAAARDRGRRELLLRRREWRSAPLGRIAVVVAATAAPLVYYLVLSQLDDAWELAGEANDFAIWPLVGHGGRPGAARAAGADGPARRARRPRRLALRLWPLAALVVFVQPFGTFPAHALQGMTLPLVTLAFLGVGASGAAAWRWRPRSCC